MKQRYELKVDHGTTVRREFRFGIKDGDDVAYTDWPDDVYVLRIREDNYSYHVDIPLTLDDGRWVLELTANMTDSFKRHRKLYFAIDRRRDGDVKRMLEGPIRVNVLGGAHHG